MTYTRVLHCGPGAMRSPADPLMSPKTGDIRLTGNCSINRQGQEAQKDEKPFRFSKLK